MPDIVPPEVRSRMMSGIRSKDTRHEVALRKMLHAAGFRYRLHRRDMLGTPDITLPRHGATVFVHGCFWHGHECHLFKWPSTNRARWTEKILSNRHRDEETKRRLLEGGWRVCMVWECATRGRYRRSVEEVAECVIKWIQSSTTLCEVSGMAETDEHP